MLELLLNHGGKGTPADAAPLRDLTSHPGIWSA